MGAVREHFGRCTELVLPDQTGLLDALHDWSTHLHGPSPAREQAAAAHRGQAADLADRAAALGQRLAELAERRAAASRELAELEAGAQQGPQPPHTRTPGLRDRTPGAPLWRLVDFHDHVTPDERAGLEAALEASGLLDAWVCPDGTLLEASGHDVLLSPPPSHAPRAGAALGDALRPASTTAIPGPRRSANRPCPRSWRPSVSGTPARPAPGWRWTAASASAR
ncbi:hypothetical protein [Streptomyces hygroscopicus]|uniref:hypothetical protein n=1 Tax=Streptomyces hygroscopicus TaxID=1912 RepID=UPI000B1B9D11|nr:hypothetical protein [Streptomyces hygroscopicus]